MYKRQISLSAAVIIIYGLFFAPPPPDPKKINNEKNNIVESTSEAPSLDQNVEVSKISRNEAIENEDRVQFENSTVIGSISLVGGSIDDLTFKKYTNTLNGDDNVILLNPKKVEDGYYIEKPGGQQQTKILIFLILKQFGQLKEIIN